jgi:hypothetical protein
MATPHVSAVIALMLQKNPSLNQKEVEDVIKSTALSIPYYSSMKIFDPAVWDWVEISWGGPEATGVGLIQADRAIEAVP